MSKLEFFHSRGEINALKEERLVVSIAKTSSGKWMCAFPPPYVVPVDDLREILQEIEKTEAKNDD